MFDCVCVLHWHGAVDAFSPNSIDVDFPVKHEVQEESSAVPRRGMRLWGREEESHFTESSGMKAAESEELFWTTLHYIC